MIFICDVMLGKLARYLRMLGFDARYIKQGKDIRSLPAPSAESLFLTKKKGDGSLREQTIVIQNNDPEKQVLEIMDHIKKDIDPAAFMTRCMKCNTILVDVPGEDIEQSVPEYIYHHHKAFRVCPSCKKVYWEGSHAEKMREWLRKLIDLENL